MNWLSNSKVRLALIVNGLYLLILFEPTAPRRTYTNASLSAGWAGHEPDNRRPSYPPLPPPTGPLKATTNYAWESNQMNVTLTNDLRLVVRPDHRLLLSPIFSARAQSPEPPRSILLRFVSFSRQLVFSDESPLVITADGFEMWRYGTGGEFSRAPANSRALYSTALDDKGNFVETLGHEIPYEIFFAIISARKVTINLGPDRAELTPTQIEALRDMHRQLP